MHSRLLVGHGPSNRLLVEEHRVGPLAATLSQAHVERGSPETRLHRNRVEGVDRLVVSWSVLADQVVSGTLRPTTIFMFNLVKIFQVSLGV